VRDHGIHVYECDKPVTTFLDKVGALRAGAAAMLLNPILM
jgi:hypothetical protein